MRKIKMLFLTLTLFSGMILSCEPSQAQVTEVEKLYEEGVYQLEALGNFEEAIRLFDQVVREYPSNKLIAAKALLKQGLCYERLGSQKAEEAYVRIIEKFPDQSQQVTEARERLAALRRQNDAAGQTVKLTYDGELLECNSLSPDGTRMAGTDFSEGQNIAFFDLTLNERKLVTHHDWYDVWTYYPVWSPDGKELAYIRSGWQTSDPQSLWVSMLDGEARPLYSSQSPGLKIYPSEWLPNGKGVVVVMQDSSGYSLGIIPVRGGSYELLFKFDDQSLNSASVSPNSRYIVFADGMQGKKDLRVIDIETKEVTTLIDNPASDTSPRWSPDGRYIVFKSDRHGDWAIWGVAVEEIQPVGVPFMIMPGARDFRLLNWSPVGLAMSRVISSLDIYTLSVDPLSGKAMGEPLQLRYTPTGSNVTPAWSPDGNHIAFIKHLREKFQFILVVTTPTGSDANEFMLPPKCTPGYLRWTPDGNAIGFAGYDSTQKSNLFRLTLGTGTWENWPIDISSWTQIEWAKDGGAIYYFDNGVDGSEAKLMTRPIGVEEAQVFYRPIDKKSPIRSIRFSRDFRRMTFQQGDGVNILDMASHNDTALKPENDTLWQGQVSPLSFRSPSWSPDGKSLMIVKVITDEKMNQTFELNVYHFESGIFEKINLGNTLPKDVQIRGIEWSPDGNEVALMTVSWFNEAHLMKTVIPAVSDK